MPNNCCQKLNFQERLMTELTIFRKMHQFKEAIMLYQSSLERKKFCELKETHLFHLVIKTVFRHAVLYIRTSMCSLCICLLQFLTHEIFLFVTLSFKQCMYRFSERLTDWDKYRQQLHFVANILGLIMINKKKQLPAN